MSHNRIQWRCDTIDKRSGWLGEIMICEIDVTYWGHLGVCSVRWLLPGVPMPAKPTQYTQFDSLREDAERALDKWLRLAGII